jgi:ribonuclease VapC
MIAVDTSALMAVVLNEDDAEECRQHLQQAETILLSAATLAEALIVAGRRNVGAEMVELLAGLDCDVVPVTQQNAVEAAAAYALWGKGVHPAALNYGDCFAYALSKAKNVPLLFTGNDFRQTDIAVVIG